MRLYCPGARGRVTGVCPDCFAQMMKTSAPGGWLLMKMPLASDSSLIFWSCASPLFICSAVCTRCYPSFFSYRRHRVGDNLVRHQGGPHLLEPLPCRPRS